MSTETHEVDTSDSKISKYETILYLVSTGYIATTILTMVDGFMFVLYPEKVPTIIDGALGTAWVGWTAGMFGWLLGKNGKE